VAALRVAARVLRNILQFERNAAGTAGWRENLTSHPDVTWHAIRKGQAKWVGVGQIVRQLQFIAVLFWIAI
jgi:hypothetical protein